MKRSVLIAAALAVGATLWVASGALFGGDANRAAEKPPADLTATQQVPRVRVRMQQAEPLMSEALLRGQTEAWRTVDLKAETHGRVVELPVTEGSIVKKGQVIARLSEEGRPALLAEAEALLEQRRIEYDGAVRLAEKGFRAEMQVAQAKAALETAHAAVKQAAIELGNTTIKAPFEGVLNDRMVELGAYVEPGDPVAQIVDLDPILIVGHVNERDAGGLSIGAPGQARLVTGTEVDGSLRYISSVADPNTRTFRVELEVANPQRLIADGITAELRLPREKVMAHRISPALLTLSDDGEVGVKVVGADNAVAFHPVQIVADDPNGVWVTGLPGQVMLITVGQEFVATGQQVRPVDEKSLEPIDEGGLL